MVRLYQLSVNDEFYVSENSQYHAPKEIRLRKLDRKGGRCADVNTGTIYDIPTMAFVELASPSDPQSFGVKLGAEVEELLNETFNDEEELE